jgi:hypothetical protein
MPLPRKLSVQVIALATPASDVAQEVKPGAELHVGELPDGTAIEEQQTHRVSDWSRIP